MIALTMDHTHECPSFNAASDEHVLPCRHQTVRLLLPLLDQRENFFLRYRTGREAWYLSVSTYNKIGKKTELSENYLNNMNVNH